MAVTDCDANFSIASMDPSHLDDSLAEQKLRRSTTSNRRDTADSGMLRELMLDLKNNIGYKEHDSDLNSVSGKKSEAQSFLASILESDDEDSDAEDFNIKRPRRRFTAETADLASLLALREELLEEQTNESVGNAGRKEAESDNDEMEENRNKNSGVVVLECNRRMSENSSPSTVELLAASGNFNSNVEGMYEASSPTIHSSSLDKDTSSRETNAKTPSPTT
eukprot:7508533-Ditylum_brightwellii.AAC.1